MSVPAHLGVRDRRGSRSPGSRGRDPDQPIVVYLPEGMRPRVLAVACGGGELAPAPAGPRWIAYGDSIAEGWIASGTGRARGRPSRRDDTDSTW